MKLSAKHSIEPLEARIAPDVLAVVRRAAEIEGRSLSDFVVGAAQEAARRTIEQTQTTETIAFDRWRELGADGVIKGSVRRTGNTLQVEMRLFNVRARAVALGRVYGGIATYLAATLGILCVGLVANYFPAHEATRVEPMAALRDE
mgnify:CR=1 FL=1